MKVLIINQGNTENYGDIAINNTITNFFLHKKIECDNLLYWDEKEVFGRNYEHYADFIKNILWKKMFLVDKLNYFRFLKKINNRKYDAVIIGGGELIGSHLGFNSSLYVITSIFKKKNIPIILYGVSGDVNISEFYQKRYKKALSRIDFIYVRDKKTADNIKKYYNIDVNYSPDVVFAHDFLKKKKRNQKIVKNAVTVVPIDFYDEIKNNLSLNNKDDYFKYLEELITKNIQKNDIIYITCTTKEDNGIIKEFFEYLKKSLIIKNKIKIYYYSNLNNFEKLLSKTKLVISARMHALILGLNNNCNVYAIPFKEKLKEFGNNYSIPMNAKNNEKEVLKSLNSIYEFIMKKEV